jgi:hypothetical protein
MAGSAFGHDYRMDMEWSIEEQLRQDGSNKNWIYIGADVERGDMAKIGLTTGQLGTRASGTQNIYYTLFCAFKIKDAVTSQQVKTIETEALQFLSEHYERLRHQTTGKLSEWYRVTPLEMKGAINDFLYLNFSKCMHCYYCDIRDAGIIHSWENKDYLQCGSRPKYRASDLSSPPIDPNCLNIGGCGRDCDCWD